MEFVHIPAGTFYKGTIAYDGNGAPEVYPLMMTIKDSVGVHVEGTICWPTLSNAMTKFRGDVNGRVLTFVEYEIIRGSDQVEVPTKYQIEFDDTFRSAKGKVLEGESASLSLESLSAVPVKVCKPSTTTLKIEISLASDESQRAKVTWKSDDGKEISKSDAVVRREGNDLIITEVAPMNASDFVSCSDPLLANSLLP